jgi:hypothetical protein
MACFFSRLGAGATFRILFPIIGYLDDRCGSEHGYTTPDDEYLGLNEVPILFLGFGVLQPTRLGRSGDCCGRTGSRLTRHRPLSTPLLRLMEGIRSHLADLSPHSY